MRHQPRGGPIFYCVHDYGEQRESLVDLERDPGEMANLATEAAHAGTLNEHRRMLHDWSRKAGNGSFPVIEPTPYRMARP